MGFELNDPEIKIRMFHRLSQPGVPLDTTFESVLYGSWHTAGIRYSCELVEGRDYIWLISTSQGPLQKQAEGKHAYWMKNTGFANWLPLGLLDREGLELSFQDFFQSNHFKRPHKQRRLKAGFLGQEGRSGTEEEKLIPKKERKKASLFPFIAKLIN